MDKDKRKGEDLKVLTPSEKRTSEHKSMLLIIFFLVS